MADMAGKRMVVADPRGFCAGVDRAILAVRTILRTSHAPGESGAGAPADGGGSPEGRGGLPPVYVRRQIVHNRHVVDELAGQGAVFVDELDEIPDAAVRAGIPVVFSAHGVSPAVQEEARRRGMHIVDATCPLVSKVHREVLRYVRDGYEIVYIGHRGHDEAVGVVGEAPEHVHLIEGEDDVDSLEFAQGQRLAMLSQTTLSVDETAAVVAALKRRFPWIEEPSASDICYATQNRQTAVKLVAGRSDCVVIVGSANSSNSVRLVEVAQEVLGSRGGAWLVDDAGGLDPRWFAGVSTVGISSGASVPEDLVSGVMDRLREWGFVDVSYVETVKETMRFVLPARLRETEDLCGRP